MDTALAARMDSFARDFAPALQRAIEQDAGANEHARPHRLVAAMLHGALNGGKRLRPFLLVESARLFGEPPAGVTQAAVALECVHCYSLVHDDLPAMDDDDMRRGQPTVHIAYDEATAILAGDALLTLAFDLIAEAGGMSAETRIALISELARASGAGGMVGGQMLDIEAETTAPDEAGIVRLQAMKTGALLRFAARAGALAMAASADDRIRLTRYGEAIGLAFQIADDLLDLTADAATLGKATGKDAARGKGTLVSLHGVDWARARLDALVAEAHDTLTPFGDRAATLRALAAFVANRSN